MDILKKDNTEPRQVGNDLQGVTTRSSLRDFAMKFYDDNDHSRWVTDERSAAMPKEIWDTTISSLNELYQQCSKKVNSYFITKELLAELNLNFKVITFRKWLKAVGVVLIGQEKSFTSEERSAKIGARISYLRNTTTLWDESGKKNAEVKRSWTEDRKKQVYANPIRNNKISASRKVFLKNNPEFKENMIRKFMAAPKHTFKPNTPEKNVISLNIPGVCFTGDGNYFVSLSLQDGEVWHKNPDFICKEFETQRRVKAVVEIMDFEFWHTKEEADLVTSLYNAKGIGCLVIDAKKCYTKENLKLVREEIVRFLKAYDVVWTSPQGLELSGNDSTDTCENKCSVTERTSSKTVTHSKKAVYKLGEFGGHLTVADLADEGNTEPSAVRNDCEGVTTTKAPSFSEDFGLSRASRQRLTCVQLFAAPRYLVEKTGIRGSLTRMETCGDNKKLLSAEQLSSVSRHNGVEVTDVLEQILVAEDKVWRRLAVTAAPTYNDLVYFSTFTPTVFSEMRQAIASWGIPVTTCVLAFDLWNDIIADTEFSSWFDPISKHEIVLEGALGSLMGVQLITDGFRYETLKVLEQGEVFMCGAPQTLGGITQRKELATETINLYNQGKPERGWFMSEIIGAAIIGARAMSYGQRT